MPTDRRNPDFWEQLEDRMATDPNPPANVNLELALPSELRSLFEYVSSGKEEN